MGGSAGASVIPNPAFGHSPAGRKLDRINQLNPAVSRLMGHQLDTVVFYAHLFNHLQVNSG
jgi:hypothetical protein